MSVGADVVSSREEQVLLARLRDGDERAFELLVDQLYPAMAAVARGYVSTRATVDEVVQEAWLAVLKGIERFEGRSSLKTWVLRIVANIAITRSTREARSIPMAFDEVEPDEPSVPSERFRSADDPYPGHWQGYPVDWRSLPEDKVIDSELLGVVRQAIEQLPEAQRLVITMRDVAGCSPEEVCEALGVTDGNQRVLLHRARARVRTAIEGSLGV